MILKTFDGKEMFITVEQADNIAKAIQSGTKLIQISTAYVAAGAVATILPGGTDPNQKTLPPPERPQISPEQRQRNIDKIADMKREYLERSHSKA